MKKRSNIRIIFAKASCWFLFVALLNTVIDTVVISPANTNEIESVAEWVAEEWMDMDIEIPDTDGEQDDKQHVHKKSADWYAQDITYASTSFTSNSSQFPLALMPVYFNPVFDIHSPPPDSGC